MNCTSPIWLTKGLDKRKYPDGLEVPCGKCLNCRIQTRTMWATRIYHEADYWPEKSFITLTYDEENCPKTISKAELQKFFKRLRKRISPLKYFACGEYGGTFGRPHYHAILLGCGLTEKHKLAVMDSWPKCMWDHPTIRKNSFGLVEPESIQYVCKYIHQKLSGEKANEEFTQYGMEIPFRLVSHGIGARYAEDHHEQLRSLGYVSVRGSKRSVPRYYLQKANFSIEEIEGIKDRALRKEVEFCESITGLSYTRAESYRFLRPDDVLKIEEEKRNRSDQLEKNRTSRIDLAERTLRL